MKSLKNFVFILIIITSSLISSCSEKGSGNVIRVARTTSSFNQVKLIGSFNLYIRQDSVQKIEIVTDDNIAPHVTTEVYNNLLTIKNDKNFRKVTVSDIYISVPTLVEITLEGSGRIQGENTFKGTNMTTTIKGSGDLSLSFEGSNLYTTIDGSGNMNLSGSSNDAHYTISGSGNINASNLNANNITATVSGSGNIDLIANTSLQAIISGSGNINYYGNPSVTVNISGSGSVKRKLVPIK